MSDIPPLEAEIRRLIAAAGPITVAQYMSLCLTHPKYGYYVTRDPLGATGDFITAPEISQMFGELIGLWMASVWRQMGSPENVRVVELGPGRCTMMADALRAAQVVPGFRAATVIHLVEISPVLQMQQFETLSGVSAPVHWHTSIEQVPAGPLIVLANEFFDALPVHQAVKYQDGWHERTVDVAANGNLVFSVAAEPIPHFDGTLPRQLRAAPVGALFEWRTDHIAMEIGRRIARSNGAALVIDYGHAQSDAGDTFQAVGRHAFADPLAAPGLADLTAHVDFQALGQEASSMGASVYGPVTQGELLERLGIMTRAAALTKGVDRSDVAAIEIALSRLIGQGRTAMGELFKAIAFADPKIGPPPGFGG
jgi:SAM-dependent MidA family methyltransferase